MLHGKNWRSIFKRRRELFAKLRTSESGSLGSRTRGRRGTARLWGSERLESRRTMAAGASLLAGLDSDGNFRIVDSTGAVDDSVLIYRSGDLIVAYSEAGIEADGIDQTEAGNSVSVEAELITGQIIVDLKGGSNSLVVAWSAEVEGEDLPPADEEGDPTVRGGLFFTVTNDGEADDSIVVVPPPDSPVAVDYATAIVSKFSGTVHVGGATGPVRFANLENSEDAPLTLVGSLEVTFNLPGLADSGELGIAELADGDAVVLRSNRTAGGTFATTYVVTEAEVAITVNMGRDNGSFVVSGVRGDVEASDAITVNGGAGNDTINVGTAGAPVTLGVALNGDDGNDNLGGGGGDDVLSGGPGEDTLRGAAGDDELKGGSSRDRLLGEAGDDSLAGEQGDDMLDGGIGDDSLSGGVGNDTLNGNAGIDEIRGDEGSDLIQILGDQAYVVDNCDDMNGGSGIDTIEFIGNQNVVLPNFGGDDDFSVSIERINGRGRALVGTAVANVFDLSRITAVNLLGVYGLAGDDTIIGTSGNDTIYGHSPDAGFAADDDDSIDGGGGNDQLYGGAGADEIEGGSGNDTINGGTDDDTIDGGSGNDLLETRANESEDDEINGGPGIDVLANIGNLALVLAGFDGRSNGIETVRGNNQDIVGNGGENNLDFRRPATGSVNLIRVTAIRGAAGDDAIYGTAAADRIFGDAGDDLIVGGLGNDYLRGGDGDDSLNGGGGVDSLFGDNGADVLTGGEAFDIFVFRNSPGDNDELDTITDFRNDFLRFEGFSRGAYASDYAAIQSVRTEDGLRLTQSSSGKRVLLNGTLREKPPRSRFIFTEGDGLGS